MIQIKSKPGYNVIINDLNIALRAENNQWIAVSKEEFEASSDAKKLLQFIEIDETGKLESPKNEVASNVREVGSAYIIDKGNNLEMQSEGIFTADPDKSAYNAEKTNLLEDAKLEVEAKEIEDTTEEEIDETIPDLTPVDNYVEEENTTTETTTIEDVKTEVPVQEVSESVTEEPVKEETTEESVNETPALEDLSKEVLIAEADNKPKRAGRPPKSK